MNIDPNIVDIRTYNFVDYFVIFKFVHSLMEISVYDIDIALKSWMSLCYLVD